MTFSIQQKKKKKKNTLSKINRNFEMIYRLRLSKKKKKGLKWCIEFQKKTSEFRDKHTQR